MNKHEQLYMSFIKQEIQYLESGTISDAVEQATLINSIIQRISMIQDEQLYINIQQYLKEQQRIQVEKEKISTQLNDLMDEEHENLKNMYEQVLLKL